MFYSKALISKGGPLQLVWIASYSDRRTRRRELLGTSISDAVNCILLPEDGNPAAAFAAGARAPLGLGPPSAASAMPLALRLSGQLLLGVVRVYKDQIVYLAEDIESALYNLQLGTKAEALLPAPATDASNVAASAAGAAVPGSAQAAPDAPHPETAAPAGDAAALGRKDRAKLNGRLQRRSELEELVAALSGLDEEEAFLDGPRGGEGALPDWTEPTRGLQATQGAGGLRTAASLRPSEAGGVPSFATPMPHMRGPSQDIVSGLGSAEHSAFVRSRGVLHRSAAEPEVEEVFGEWDEGDALPFDLDAPVEVWLLNAPKTQTQGPAPSNKSQDVRAEGGRHEAPALAPVPGEAAPDAPAHTDAPWVAQEDEEVFGDDGPLMTGSEMYGEAQRGTQDDDHTEPTEHPDSPQHEQQQQPGPARDTAAGRQGPGVSLRMAGMTRYPGTQLMDSEGPGQHGAGSSSTMVPSASVRALLDDRTPLMHPARAHLYQAALGYAPSSARGHAEAGGRPRRSATLHLLLLHQQQERVAPHAPARVSGDIAADRERQLLLHQRLERGVVSGPFQSLRVSRPGQGEGDGHVTSRVGRGAGVSGTQVLQALYGLRPYLAAGTAASQEGTQQELPHTDDSTAARLHALGSASGLLSAVACSSLLRKFPMFQSPARPRDEPTAPSPTPRQAKKPRAAKADAAAATDTAKNPTDAPHAADGQQEASAAGPRSADRALASPQTVSGGGGGDSVGGVQRNDEPMDTYGDIGIGYDDVGGDTDTVPWQQPPAEDPAVLESELSDSDAEEWTEGPGDAHTQSGAVGQAGVAGGHSDGFTARTRRLLTHLSAMVQGTDQQAQATPSQSSQGKQVSVSEEVLPLVLSQVSQGPVRGGTQERASDRRITAARAFVDLLVLQNRSYVKLSQPRPFQDLTVLPRPKLYEALPTHTQPTQDTQDTPAPPIPAAPSPLPPTGKSVQDSTRAKGRGPASQRANGTPKPLQPHKAPMSPEQALSSRKRLRAAA